MSTWIEDLAVARGNYLKAIQNVIEDTLRYPDPRKVMAEISGILKEYEGSAYHDE